MNNFMVVFPAYIPHAITPLYTESNKDVSFLEQRFSIQFWVRFKMKNKFISETFAFGRIVKRYTLPLEAIDELNKRYEIEKQNFGLLVIV